MRHLGVLLALTSLPVSVMAYTVSFDSGKYSDGTSITYESNRLPTGWGKTGTGNIGLYSAQPRQIDGANGFCVDFQTASKGSNIFYKDAALPQNDIFSDYITVSFRTYVQSYAALIDRFQVVVSSNKTDWIAIGTSMPIRSGSTARWVTYDRSAEIEGISGWSEVYFGVEAIAAGRSSTLGYIAEVSINSQAGMIIRDFHLEYDGEKLLSLDPTTNNITIKAQMDCQPEDEDVLSIVGVAGVIVRNGITNSYPLSRQDNSNWFSSSAVLPRLDAGETIELNIVGTYESFADYTVGTCVEGNIYKIESHSSSNVVGKLGSVWLNEFNGGSVELFGTTNRVYMDGWRLQLSSGGGVFFAELGTAFNFAGNMIEEELVGIETRDNLAWRDVSGNSVAIGSGTYELKLLNSAGRVEHSVQVELPGVYGMSGVAAWPSDGYSYDWTGTANSNVFSWIGLDNETFGSVNEGQDFKTPVYAKTAVRTVVTDGEITNVFPSATVELAITNMQNEVTNTVSVFKKPTINGVAEFNIDGYSADTNFNASASVVAFGWKADDQPLEIAVSRDVHDRPQTEKDMVLLPALAEDDFSNGISSYWSNDGSLKWYKNTVTRNGKSNSVISLNTSTTSAPYTNAVLDCKNILNSRGKRKATISFDLYNGMAQTDSTRYDEAYVTIGTNSAFTGYTVSTKKFSTKNRNLANNFWRNCLSVCALPQWDDVPLQLSLTCLSKGRTGQYVYLDNLRIAFQDMATVTNVVRTGTEANPGYEIDVEPWCASGQCVSNVSVQLVMEVEGRTKVVFTNDAVAVSSGLVTNNLSAVTTFTVSSEVISTNLMNSALNQDRLRAHDAVRCWALVNYYADSRDPDPAKEWETRYFPDNSTVDGEGRWVVEGEYGVDEAKITSNTNCSYTVSGDPISLNGEFLSNADDVTQVGFGFRAYDAEGVSNVTVNVSGGAGYNETFNFVTNGIKCFDNTVLATGLAANTNYTVTIVATNKSGVSAFSTNFWTRPVAPTVTVKGISTNAVMLTASGNAAGVKVLSSSGELSSGWMQERANTWTNTWTLSGGPNDMFTATVCATNVVGQESASVVAVGYSLAAVSTNAPTITKGVSTVTVGAGEDHVAVGDGNPDGTEYAIRVSTNGMDYVTYSTNDVESGIIWKTLAEWNTNPETLAMPAINLAETNYFAFVTRNFDGDPTANDSLVSTNCWFDMTAGFDNAQTGQRADGSVNISLAFFDPAQSADATAEVQYRIDRGDWTPLSSFAVSCADLIVATNLEWNAWTAVGETQGTYLYNLRVKISSGSRSSGWAEWKDTETETLGTLDFVPPTVTIGGSPEAGLTSATGYSFTFSADEENVTYAWERSGTSGASGTGNSASGSGLADGAYTLTVTGTDAFGNIGTATRSWTVDATAPTWGNPPISGTPDSGVVTRNNSVHLSASATDATEITFHWTLNGVDRIGASIRATAQEGANTASVYVVDAAGNVSSTNYWTWTLDTIAPTTPVISGTPANGASTRFAAVDLSAHSEDATAITYSWNFNGVQSTGASLVSTASEGENRVSVRATDEAGNISEASWTWTLDTAPPSLPVFTAKPDQYTNVKAYSVAANSTDLLSGVSGYYWSVNGGAFTAGSATLTGEAGAEGEYTVRVYAVDGVGNASATNSCTWTYDATAPSEPTFTAKPEQQTNVKGYSLTASSTDSLSGVSGYYWSVNGGAFTAGGTTFAGEAGAEGEYTVRVYATDNAGNASATNSWTWVYDATAPLEPTFTAKPSQYTNVKGYSLTASSTDALTGVVEYYWSVNGGAFSEHGATLTGEAGAEGEYTVRVYSVDGAGNASATNSWTWVYDATAPSEPAFTAKPDQYTNVKAYSVTANSTDALSGVSGYYWSVNGGAFTAGGVTLTGEAGAEGEYTVRVYAADRAGNVSATNTWSWVYDATAPSEPTFTAKPEQFVSEAQYSLTANSTDALTGVSAYYWSVNDGAFVAGGATFAGEVDAEGRYTVKVYATDRAGNVSATNSWTWTYDVTAPSMPEFTAKPARYTNVKGYSLAVETTEAVSGVSGYYWSMNGGAFAIGEATLNGEAVEEGEYTARVYAVDGAGNVSATNSWTWTYDKTSPTVGLSSDTPDHFNLAAAPMTVTVMFSEPVTNFTAESVYVTNKSDIVVSPLGVATNIYTVTITPQGDGEVSVQIPAGVVADYAGNGNEASATLSRIYDTTPPTVTLTSDTPAPPAKLNCYAMPFAVTVTFSEPVTNFTADAVTVSNGTVAEVVVSQNPETTNKVYVITINPENEDVTSISVQIESGKVTDLAGNLNEEASNEIMRDCDVKRPTIGIINTKTARIPLSVTIQFSETVTNYIAGTGFREDSVNVENGTPEVEARDPLEPTIKITPNAGVTNMTFRIEEGVLTDLAGNENVASKKLIFTYDGSSWQCEEEPDPLPPTSDMEFGSMVSLPVNPDTGETNSVSFTTLGFKPGAVSTFTLSGFDATASAITDLQMWFIVGETIGGARWYEKVNESAEYDSGARALTVTLPGSATEKSSGVPYRTFFIFGVDNKSSAQ